MSPKSQPKEPKGRIALTPRDEVMLAELARFRVLTLEQLRRRHFPEGALSTCKNRVGELQAAGYVARMPMGYGQGAVWLVTPLGAAASGTGLPAPRPRTGYYQGLPAGYYRHHTVVADVAEALLRKAAGVAVAAVWETEAEWNREHYVVGHAGEGRPDGVLCLTGPDGVGQRLAVEVELTPKPDRAYAAKFAWYRQRADAGAFMRVRWYCGDETTRRTLERAVAAAHRTVPVAGYAALLEVRELATLLGTAHAPT